MSLATCLFGACPSVTFLDTKKPEARYFLHGLHILCDAENKLCFTLNIVCEWMLTGIRNGVLGIYIHGLSTRVSVWYYVSVGFKWGWQSHGRITNVACSIACVIQYSSWVIVSFIYRFGKKAFMWLRRFIGLLSDLTDAMEEVSMLMWTKRNMTSIKSTVNRRAFVLSEYDTCLYYLYSTQQVTFTFVFAKRDGINVFYNSYL